MNKFLFALVLVVLGMTNTQAQVKGDWKGTLDIQGQSLDIIFHLSGEDDALTGSMDIPMQGATGIPLSRVTLTGDSLFLGLDQAGLQYAGVVAGNKIDGKYTQGGMEFPLVLEKTVVIKPGDTTLVSTPEQIQQLIAKDKGDFKYRVEDYFAKPKMSGFQLSPSGKYLLYRVSLRQ